MGRLLSLAPAAKVVFGNVHSGVLADRGGVNLNFIVLVEIINPSEKRN